MIIDIHVPTPGESITEVELTRWLVANGDIVEKNQEIAEIDSDKATLTINAEETGKISILVSEGNRVPVKSIIANIDTSFAIEKSENIESKVESIEIKQENKTLEHSKTENHQEKNTDFILSPQATKVLEDEGIDINEFLHNIKGNRITKAEVLKAIAYAGKVENTEIKTDFVVKERAEEVKPMTPLRKKLAERLVAVKNQTAMLTTFNEIDMSEIMRVRKDYGEKFKQKYGIKLGLMSFFSKACTEAMALYPQINASVDGSNVVLHHFTDLGVAVSTPKGLMVPIIRNAEKLSLAEIEIKLNELATKARDNKITIDDLTGGTFTITNGGVFGSMMSTPIINPPQSAILGMHNIVDRPVAINGKVEIRPMMYVALSYDHRIIDGRESVGFLVKIKELLENPIKLLNASTDPYKQLLQID